MTEKLDLWSKHKQNKIYKELSYKVKIKKFLYLRVILNKHKKEEEEIVYN